MLDALYGKWKLVKTHDFDKYLDALDVGLSVKQLGKETDVHVVISQEEKKVKVETVMPGKSTEFEAELGEQFDQITVDDREVKSLLTEVDGKLVLVQKWGDKENIITREVQNGKMVTSFSCGGVTATRKFERVKT